MLLCSEFDVREPHVCKAGKVSLICLNNHVKYAQAKCIAVNPRRPELIAIGSNDCYARVYDRRMMILDSVNGDHRRPRRPRTTHRALLSVSALPHFSSRTARRRISRRRRATPARWT